MSENAAPDRTFAVGEWYAVAGEQVTVLLPAQARPRVARLWDLADSGASFDEVLDGLLADGLSSLDGFALIGHGARLRVLLRGDVTATFSTQHGEIAMAHDRDAVWAERTLDGVTGGRVTAGAAVVEPALPLVAGISRVGTVQFAQSSLTEPGERELEAEIEPEMESESEPETEVESQSEVEVDHEVGAHDAGDLRAVGGIETELMAPLGTQVDQPDPGGHPVEPLSFGEPDVADEAPTGDRSELADSSAYPDDDHDGHTTAGPAAEDFARPRVGIPGQEPAPPVVARPVAKLVISTGEVVDVDRVILVGRAPQARSFASSDLPRLVTVASPQHEISSTHLEIRPGAGADLGTAIVTDMGSTNGTVLVQPGLPPEELRAGMAVSLIPGAILDLGDGVTIQTTNP